MAAVPDLEKTPTSDTSVNEPESGTYGEKADLARLRQSLPPMGPPGTEGTGASAPAPTPGPAGPGLNRPTGRPKNAPEGVPAPLLAPTQRPDVPLSQPLAPGPAPMPPKAAAADQQRLSVLDALANHPEVSEETREWAALVLDILITGRR